MQYFKVAQTNEVKDGEKRIFVVNDKTFLITNIGNTYYAIDNKCPHMGGSLYEGNLDGYQITCPKHGSVFDARTGVLIKGGKIAFIKVNPNNAQAYPVKIEGTDVLIGIE